MRGQAVTQEQSVFNDKLDRNSHRKDNSIVIGTVAVRSALKKTRSFSLDPDVLTQVERTKGNASASERVNQLLKCALEMERKASLYDEAARFFSTVPDDREERRAFQKANRRTWRE
jgi:hypothetical protein